ncbi:MAG: type II toxin-antitoxin system RelE/ParE family toxin [bacterium]|nr:type II toxin-antitoxin system RelE/ParE family toxin [bacterium]
MMDLVAIRTGRSFSITALRVNGNCHTLEFLESLEQDNPGEHTGILALLEYSANNGPPKNIEKCKPLGHGLFEFKYKHTRLLFFYQAGHIIICTHGFWKQSQKTPPKEINKAKELKKIYLGGHNE